MKRYTAPVFLLAAALAACSPKAAEQMTNAAASTTAPVAASPTAEAAMSKVAMSPDTKIGRGAGTVTAMDATAGTITLAHGPIPEVNWPAMTMAFKASPAIIGQVKVGEKVDFDLKLEGGAGEVTAVRKGAG